MEEVREKHELHDRVQMTGMLEHRKVRDVGYCEIIFIHWIPIFVIFVVTIKILNSVCQEMYVKQETLLKVLKGQNEKPMNNFHQFMKIDTNENKWHQSILRNINGIP